MICRLLSASSSIGFISISHDAIQPLKFILIDLIPLGIIHDFGSHIGTIFPHETSNYARKCACNKNLLEKNIHTHFRKNKHNFSTL
jgi:hypothetical protein